MNSWLMKLVAILLKLLTITTIHIWKVKNEAAKDFLELLKHWEKLCKNFVTKDLETYVSSPESASDATDMNLDAQSGSDISDEELEALSLVDICFGDAGESGKCGLKFKVHFK